MTIKDEDEDEDEGGWGRCLIQLDPVVEGMDVEGSAHRKEMKGGEGGGRGI